MCRDLTERADASWRQRCGLALFGLALGLAALETGLRVTAAVVLWREARQNQLAAAAPGRVRILCIGESTTLIGHDEAYPRHLERILNGRPNGPQVSVANAGVAAVTSEYLLSRVPSWLAEYQPDVVISMMGINDPAGAPLAPIRAAFESLRIVKFARWAAEALARGRFPFGSAPLDRVVRLLDAGRLEDARQVVAAAFNEAPNDLFLLVGRAAIEARAMLPMTAEATLAEARTVAGSAVTGHETLLVALTAARLDGWAAEEAEWLRARVPPDSSRWIWVKFRLGLEVDRLLAAGHLDIAEATMKTMASLPRLADERAYDARVALIAKARGDLAGYEEKQRVLAATGAGQGSPMTSRTYRELRDLVRAQGSRLVAVQYPSRPLAPLEALLDHDPAVAFVSTEAPFRTALLEESYEAIFTDAFAGDFGHATARGNRLLAETVAEALVTRNLLVRRPGAAP
jgi:hypothetical protein